MQSTKLKSIMAIALSSAMLFATAACGTSDKADAGTDSAKGSDAATITSYDVSSVEKDDTIAALLPESVTKDGKLTIGTNPSYAPAEFLDADGKTQIGYDMDLARAMGNIFGLETEIVSSNFDTIIPAIGSKYDLGITAMTITDAQLSQFRATLRNEEKSAATLEKYLRDVSRFALWLGDRPLNRDAMLDYKAELVANYAAGSVNSILAALNRFLCMVGHEECRVHRLRIQYQAYSPEEREISAQEYADLVRTARETGRTRLALVLQTICATGIRVSELPSITAEAARRGVAVVRCKGKSRRVLIPTRLQKKLLRYMKQHRIAYGPVFVTRSGAPLDRSNIWREMKALCRAAGVSDKKVFPHNFRHLFARTFYRLNRDLAKLADLLGHSSINTTRIYIRTTSAEHRRCLERMRLVV